MDVRWFAVLALGWAWPAAAQDAAETPDFRAMSDADLQARVAMLQAEGFIDACRSKVPLFAELVRRDPRHAGYRAVQQIAAVFCADEEGRHADGLRLLKKLEREHQARPMHDLALYFATRLDDGAEALARMRAMAEAGELSEISVQSAYAGIRTVNGGGLDAEFDAFSHELTSSSGFDRFDPDLRESFASGAIRHAVKIADLPTAAGLLEAISNPGTYRDMLADRRYEAAWPQIEEHAGDNLGKVAEAHVARTAARLAEQPENRDRLSNHAHALLFAGRYQEAVDLARSWRPERSDPTDLEEGDGWALNVEAYALDALGRTAEADAVFDMLATVPADESPWVVNFVINRASRLVGQERWAEGLAATELARSVAEEHGSTYAKMLIARDRACALEHLGRSAEARSEADYLVANFNEFPPSAATGLICVGQQAEAERLVAAAFSDKAARDRLIFELQDPRFELFYTPSALPQVRELVLSSPALRDEALKRVRLLPERFVPISYIRRSRVASSGS